MSEPPQTVGLRSRQRAERRAAIIDAAVQIIATRGLGAVTHRAVAREAKVPLAATTYYFASKEEILKEALESLSAAEVKRLEKLAEDIAGLQPEEAGVALYNALVPRPAGRTPRLARSVRDLPRGRAQPGTSAGRGAAAGGVREARGDGASRCRRS